MNLTFAKDLAERAGTTFVQTLAGVVAAGPGGANLVQLDWKADLIAAGIATATSVAKSLVAGYYTGSGSLIKPATSSLVVPVSVVPVVSAPAPTPAAPPAT
jgi:Putative lactococcus lactis phage r1t holin